MAKQPDYKKLESLFTRDAAKKIQAAFAILLSNYVEIWEDGCWTSAYGEPEAVKEIRAHIAASIANLPDALQYDGEGLEVYLKQLACCKETVMAIEKTLLAYSFQLEFLSFTRRYYSGSLFYERERPAVTNISRILSDCMAYVVETGLGAAGSMRKAEVLSAFPVKMTRERYYDYVKESVLLVYRLGASTQAPGSLSFIDQYVERSRFMFKSDASPSYGAYFSDIAAKIDEFGAMEMDKMDARALEEAGRGIDALSDEITLLHDFFLLLFECVNSLIILGAFSSDFDGLFDGNFAFRDAYHAIVENMENSDKSLFYEKVSGIVSERLDILMDGVPVLNEKCEKQLQGLANQGLNQELPEQEDLNGVIRLRNAVAVLFYESMTESAYRSGETAAPVLAPEDAREYAESRAGALVDFMKNALADVPLKKQRLMKQFFLRRIFCPFDDDEFLEYIKDSFTSARDSAQVAVIASSVAGTIRKDGLSNHGDESETEKNPGYGLADS